MKYLKCHKKKGRNEIVQGIESAQNKMTNLTDEAEN